MAANAYVRARIEPSVKDSAALVHRRYQQTVSPSRGVTSVAFGKCTATYVMAARSGWDTNQRWLVRLLCRHVILQ